jgi:hypothetical protein
LVVWSKATNPITKNSAFIFFIFDINLAFYIYLHLKFLEDAISHKIFR